LFIQVVNQKESAVNGFRNTELFQYLFPDATLSVEEKQRNADRVTCKFHLI